MGGKTRVQEKLLEDAIQMAREAGALIRERMADRGIVEQKLNGSDLVTEVDKASEALIMSRIAAQYPEHWVLGEESGGGSGSSYAMYTSRGDGYGWIVDPIDGTTNFIHGLPYFAVSIGIVHNKQPVIGVVYNPLTDELYAARTGGGAYLNGVQIKVSREEIVADALLATGFCPGDWCDGSPALTQVTPCIGRCRNLRMLGAARLDLCSVAAGRLSGYWHRGLHPWDAAAGIVIVNEAGGTVTNMAGKPYELTEFTIAATNGRIHDELLALLD